MLSSRAGIGLDIFGVLVARPADSVMGWLLTLVGRG
jgi:hypothetical protein